MFGATGLPDFRPGESEWDLPCPYTHTAASNGHKFSARQSGYIASDKFRDAKTLPIIRLALCRRSHSGYQPDCHFERDCEWLLCG